MKVKQNVVPFKFIIKNKEIFSYLLFGFLTTLVSFLTYFVFTKLLGIEEVTSNGLSWICAVLFAYVTNKIFVFESKTKTMKTIFKELFSFIGARVVSGILCDIGTFAFMIKVLSIYDIVAKLITQIMVIILNYILSKFIVFKNVGK